jgi:hypothetical protein
VFVRGYTALTAGTPYSLYLYDLLKNPPVNNVVNARMEIRNYNKANDLLTWNYIELFNYAYMTVT